MNSSEVSEDKMLGGMQPDFNRSTYIVDDVSDSLEDAEVVRTLSKDTWLIIIEFF